MEKRLIIAVLLSLLVLYLWAGLTHKPIQNPTSELTQDSEIKRLTENQTSEQFLSLNSEKLDQELPIKEDDQQAIISILESKLLLVKFTNIGGGIKEIYIKNYDETLPVSNLGSFNLGEDIIFTLDKLEEDFIEYSYVADGIKIINAYRLSKDGYDLEQTTKIYNQSEMSKKIDSYTTVISIESDRMDISDKNHDKSLFEYAINAYDGILRKSNAFKFNKKEEKTSESHLVWAAFRNRYFCVINKPKFDVNGYKIEVFNDRILSIKAKTTIELERGGSTELASLIYSGPETHEILASYNLGLEKVKKFYRFGLFDIIAMAIYRLMNFIHRLIPNWGVSIVLISIIIYFSMYPLTLRGMSSMKKMQALQPEIAKIKEKHSSNPQKMNQEMMLLYKEHRINPLGGCLPFLLQMPIFIGLYQVLWRSVSFKGANFLWIKDLSKPDRVYVMPFELPFMGNEINLLPILMMIIMFYQQRLTSKNMVVTDPMQKQQQKMMGIIMPIFLGVIFYKFASGLTLYFTLFYVFSTFTQFYMYKKKA